MSDVYDIGSILYRIGGRTVNAHRADGKFHFLPSVSFSASNILGALAKQKIY